MQFSGMQASTQVKGVSQPLKVSRISRSQKESLQVVKSVGLRNIPDSERPTLFMRRVYNAGYIGGLTAVAACYAIPFFTFFYPPEEGGGSGSAVAKDKVGKLIVASEFKAANQENRSLVQGIKGDPTYIIVKDDTIQDFGVNAICTHLGCVVPWNKNAEQFQCPCHGSRYNYYGKVVRGPAPLALPLTHVDLEGETIKITPWTELDFRSNEVPWWK